MAASDSLVEVIFTPLGLCADGAIAAAQRIWNIFGWRCNVKCRSVPAGQLYVKRNRVR